MLSSLCHVMLTPASQASIAPGGLTTIPELCLSHSSLYESTPEGQASAVHMKKVSECPFLSCPYEEGIRVSLANLSQTACLHFLR